MSLNHIALSVMEYEEIENFYKTILSFRLKNNFTMNAEIALKFFKINNKTEVYFLECDGVEFEIFISSEKGKKRFSHVCLNYSDAKAIFNNAKIQGYKTEIKINHGSDNTYFIWDKYGNMFELKKGYKMLS